ncbi:MAG: STAS domain-containing protein [Proteobacteria bacterium]|nr:STAS domain-containing protein [Pseudomonadota bacterium]
MTHDQTSPFASLSLPEVLDSAAATVLANNLLSFRGRAISLDAAQVRRMGGLCLQVLISARITWKADGIPMRIERSSGAFREILSLAGAEFIVT